MSIPKLSLLRLNIIDVFDSIKTMRNTIYIFNLADIHSNVISVSKNNIKDDFLLSYKIDFSIK